MSWTDLSEKTRIILCHRYFDFSWRRWEEPLQRGNINPFEHRGLARPRPTLSPPKDWATALKNLPASEEAIPYFHEEYPAALTELNAQRPPVIYMRGQRTIPPLESLVAIVGTRNPTYTGRKNAESFSRAVTAKGLGVVSGLARGIDAIAHRQALRPYTLAVLGSGVHAVYPPEHHGLAEEIIRNGGTILSPFPDTQIIQPTNFPRRNLLIAALAAGTIVIEGAETSGANITGKLTLDLDRKAIALIQDFRSSAGRGAMQLLDWGGNYARDPEDALRIIAARWVTGLNPIIKNQGVPVPPPAEFTLDEWVDRFGDTPRALRELEARIHNGTVLPLGGGIYRSDA